MIIALLCVSAHFPSLHFGLVHCFTALHLFAHEILMFDGVPHARCEEISVSISFLQNTSQSWCSSLLDHFVIFKRERHSLWFSRDAFCYYSHMTICCLIGVQHARCQEMSVSISFLLNANQSCCSRLLDHFVVKKRLRQSFRSSRGTFHDCSHLRISCLIGVQHARCEEISVSIHSYKTLVRAAVQTS